MTKIALIPARGGSKGISKKNIKEFASKPLIYWSIKIALESKCIDRVIVSTDDKDIADIAISYSAEVPFIRPKEISLDNSPGIDPVLHALENLPEISDLLLLQPTSPIRRLEDIEKIFELRDKFNSGSVVSLTPASKSQNLHFEIDSKYKISPISKNYDIKLRQHYKTSHILNGSLYLSSKESILKYRSLITPETLGYIMPPEYSIDIDSLFDWEIAEYLMSKML